MTSKSNKVTERFIYRSDAAFTNLPDKVKSDFIKELKFRKYRKGQNIFTEGTYPSGIYFIKEGKVKTFKNLEDGREHVIYIYGEDELLGYAAFLSEESYPDSASTLSESVIGFISKEKVNKLLSEHIEFSQMLMKNLSRVFGVMVNSIVALTHKNVRERVALTLLILHDKFSKSKNTADEVAIDLCREDFANLSGTAVETLVRLLHDFKEEGLIQTLGRKILIKNKLKLVEIAEVG